MRNHFNLFIILLVAALLLCGCAVRTVDQMYYPPKRSVEYHNLQSAIDNAMVGLSYSAPVSGENQQTVQMADLDGDGTQEFLLYAKAGTDSPLRILIFRLYKENYRHIETITCNGTSFDQVEYVQMDNRGGMEIIVGRQLNDQVLRSLSVYTFTDGSAKQLISTNYTKFLAVDLDDDKSGELFVLRPGATDADNGVAELYGIDSGAMVRSNEVRMSQPSQNLKRIIVGKLHGGEKAIYAASTVGDTEIITDVYTLNDGLLTNVSLSNESGTSIKTMRNYYVYADDIDNDGVVELPALIPMHSDGQEIISDRNDIVRWYAMTASGGEIVKMYTYHNFVGGWYIQLNSRIAECLYVQNSGFEYGFYLWDANKDTYEKLMTVFALSGNDREAEAKKNGRVVLSTTESVVYAAEIESCAEEYGFTKEHLPLRFHMIQQDWKTGET